MSGANDSRSPTGRALPMADDRSVECRDPGADRALVAACINGEPAGWDGLIARYGPLVAGAVRARLAAAGVRDRSLEDELIGDAFAEISADGARALRSFRGESKLGTFLAVIGGRVAGKALRKRRTEERARRELDDRARRAGEVGEDSSAQAELGERAALLRAALEELRPREKLLLVLFHEEGKSYQEIAALIGLSPTSIGTELARARAKLAERLRARGLVDGEES